MNLSVEQFSWSKENGVWFGIADASELGLPPNEWPSVLIVEGKTGNSIFHDETLPHPDAYRKAAEEGHHYSDGHGRFIHILND